jgi:hypothetical protein
LNARAATRQQLQSTTDAVPPPLNAHRSQARSDDHLLSLCRLLPNWASQSRERSQFSRRPLHTVSSMTPPVWIGPPGGTGPILLSCPGQANQFNSSVLLACDYPKKVWPVPASNAGTFLPQWNFLGKQPKLRFGPCYAQLLTTEVWPFSSDLSGEWDFIVPGYMRNPHWCVGVV